jgi:hypothetical protein
MNRFYSLSFYTCRFYYKQAFFLEKRQLSFFSMLQNRKVNWKSQPTPRRNKKRQNGWIWTGTTLLLSSGYYYLYDKDAMDQKITSMTRSYKTFKTCTEIVCDYQWSLRSSQQPDSIGPEAYASVKSACHKRSAERLLALCRENGGVFIKL